MKAFGHQSESCDRISKLPDSVIHHILAFLPIKDVIRSGFLSRRWKDLWTSVPNLDFDGVVFSPKINFMRFVDSVLLSRNGCGIQKFRLRFGGYYCKSSSVYSWIHVAVNHSVQELSVFSHTPEPFKLPSCIFTCRSLTVLTLYNSTLNIHSSIHLPSLKTLQLFSLAFFDDNLTKFFSGCPVLENLLMEDCLLEKLTILHISSPSLKRLTINGLPKDSSLCNCVPENEIRISTPGLLSLEYTDYIAQNIFLENMSSLVNAAIDFNFEWDKTEHICGRRVSCFLGGLSNVKVLTLSSASIRLLSAAFNLLGRLPTLFNLYHLKLSTVVSKGKIRVITCFLHRAPNLELLSLDLFHRQHWFDDKEGFECENAPFEYVIGRLRIVKIRGFRGDENELVFVKYLLQHAMILERMVIVFSKKYSANSELQMEIREDILKHPRASINSEIICEPVL